MKIVHPLEPIYDENSKVLILGTMPSVKSRESNFYYAHPQNRFWKTLSRVYEEDIGKSNEERKEFLLKHNIALFDVLKSCNIESSSDSSIRNPVPNDLSEILKKSKIEAIFTTGKMAYKLYMKLIYPNTRMEAICLPSTSPANSPKGIEEKLYNEYSQLKDITEKSKNKLDYL